LGTLPDGPEAPGDQSPPVATVFPFEVLLSLILFWISGKVRARDGGENNDRAAGTSNMGKQLPPNGKRSCQTSDWERLASSPENGNGKFEGIPYRRFFLPKFTLRNPPFGSYLHHPRMPWTSAWGQDCNRTHRLSARNNSIIARRRPTLTSSHHLALQPPVRRSAPNELRRSSPSSFLGSPSSEPG
jgi:hypothetical protein